MVDKRLIVLSLPDALNDYQKMCDGDARTTAKVLGLSIDVVYAEDQLAKQIEQLSGYIRRDKARQPFALLVLPIHDKTLERVARDAARQGIGWVCLNRGADSIGNVGKEFPGVPIFGIAPDQKEIGRIQGRQFKALLPRGGKVLYVQGSASNNSSQIRLAGAQEALAGSSVEIAQVIDGNWTAEFAEMMVGRWLRTVMAHQSQVNLIGCQNDHMAVGAKKAARTVAAHLTQPEIANIPVTGVDAVPAFGQRLVAQGELLASVVMPSTAKAAVERINRILNSGQIPQGMVSLAPSSFPAEAVLARRALN
jgi:ABC-type sugar transport system substrate-binding protein